MGDSMVMAMEDRGEEQLLEAADDGGGGGFMRAQDWEAEEQQQRHRQQNSDDEEPSHGLTSDRTTSRTRYTGRPVLTSASQSGQSQLEINVATANGELYGLSNVEVYDADQAQDRDPENDRSSTPPPEQTSLSSRDRDRAARPMRRNTPPPTPPARLSSSNSKSSLKRRSSSGSSSSSSPPPIPRLATTSSSSSSSPPSAKQARLSPNVVHQHQQYPTGSGMRKTSSPPLSNERRPLAVRNPATQSSSPTSSSPPALANQDLADEEGSPSSSSPPPTSSTQQQQQVQRSANGASSSPSSSSRSSSSSPVRPQTAVRRVKVYALYDSNWIDLGTGACTYHRGIAHRKRRKGVPSTNSQNDNLQPSELVGPPPPSPPSADFGLSIAGRASREAMKRQADQKHSSQHLTGEEQRWEKEEEEEEEVELIELDSQNDTPDVGFDGEQEGGGIEEAAWLEVLKEGRWKTDLQSTDKNPPNQEKRKKSKNRKEETELRKEVNGTERQEGREGQEDHKSSDNDDDPGSDSSSEGSEPESNETDERAQQMSAEEDDYERIWTSRIERPDSGIMGLDLDTYQPHSGPEEGEEIIGRYRRQQDTLIVWKSAAGETELALSFAATAGCAEVWEFLKVVHKKWEVGDLKKEWEEGYLNSREHGEDEEAERSALAYTGGENGGSSTASSSATKTGTAYGLGIGPIAHAQSLLPDPTLSNLADIDKTVKFVGRTQLGRDKLSTLVLRTDFIRKLFPVFREAEDLESTFDLHALCLLLHSILNLNDHSLWEYVLGDDIFLDAVSILEYDPDFPTMKASYRSHLSDPSLYVEVVPIRDANTKLKIHQIYRLQYLKDVVLPRVLDDSAFSIINAFIFFHQVDIVQYLTTHETFWKELFQGIFPESSAGVINNGNGSTHHMEKQHDAIAFLQSYCQMVKQLQPHMRSQSFRALSERGLLRILSFAFTRMTADQHIRVAVVEILMLLIDNDPISVRLFIIKESGAGQKKTILHLAIDAFVKEEELGIKAQLAEAIRVLLLPAGETSVTDTAIGRTRPEDPNADILLQFFYENCVANLLEPLTKGLPSIQSQDLSIGQIALYTHLCDLLCFFIAQHSFRSKFFILSSSVTTKLAGLLHTKPKHLRLAALRYFRAAVGRNDEFYNRYLIKNNVFQPLLQLSKAEAPANNLLSSACLEFFEYIRVTNIKLLLDHIVDRFRDDVVELGASFDVFRGLVLKWEQNHEPAPREIPGAHEAHGESALSTSPDPPVLSSQQDQRSLSFEEENYFATDDDDDDDEEITTGEPLRMETKDLSLSSSGLRRSESSSHLSRYAGKTLPGTAVDGGDALLAKKRLKADDGEASIKPNAFGIQEPLSDIGSQNELSSPFGEVTDAATAAEPRMDPEQELARIREKRKREEHEEEEEDMLAKKRTTGSAAVGVNSKKQGIGASVAGGKFKLLFGAKKTPS